MENKTVIQKLPKKLNDHSVPREVRWNGVEDSMEWEERNNIINKNNIEYTKKQYEKMGIIITDEYDDLFWNVILPEGWKTKSTEHHLWTDLVDNKGKKRAFFFYKGSFWDRDAFINFSTRYHAGVDHTADPSSPYEIWKKSDYQGTVEDGNKVIFSTECIAATGSFDGDDKVKAILQEKVDKYMEENYPDYMDIHAYWE